MEPSLITAALVDAINSSTRPPALYPVAYIKYPRRELCPTVNPDGISYCLALWGWEYKHRHSPRKPPPVIDTAAIKAALNAALPDGYTVTAVEVRKTHIIIFIGGESV